MASVVVLLCGLPAAGKSSLASHVQQCHVASQHSAGKVEEEGKQPPWVSTHDLVIVAIDDLYHQALLLREPTGTAPPP